MDTFRFNNIPLSEETAWSGHEVLMLCYPFSRGIPWSYFVLIPLRSFISFLWTGRFCERHTEPGPSNSEPEWTLTAAAEIPAVWAATGVDFLMFLKPSVPHDVRTIDCPTLSVSWMCVLRTGEVHLIDSLKCFAQLLDRNKLFCPFLDLSCWLMRPKFILVFSFKTVYSDLFVTDFLSNKVCCFE